MTASKVQPLLLIAVIALILYWVVEDPLGAAEMIRSVFSWLLEFMQLLAQRVVQFLGALT